MHFCITIAQKGNVTLFHVTLARDGCPLPYVSPLERKNKYKFINGAAALLRIRRRGFYVLVGRVKQ